MQYGVSEIVHLKALHATMARLHLRLLEEDWSSATTIQCTINTNVTLSDVLVCWAGHSLKNPMRYMGKRAFARVHACKPRSCAIVLQKASIGPMMTACLAWLT